ncbi:hypothetical protein F5Y18DRAFT_437578, partial [Xylariaceae sp. FL1019]
MCAIILRWLRQITYHDEKRKLYLLPFAASLSLPILTRMHNFSAFPFPIVIVLVALLFLFSESRLGLLVRCPSLVSIQMVSRLPHKPSIAVSWIAIALSTVRASNSMICSMLSPRTPGRGISVFVIFSLAECVH